MIIPDEIMAAARVGDTQSVVRFLDEGGEVNAVDARGATMLGESVINSHVELCRVLIARGADPTSSGHDGNGRRLTCPLWMAAHHANGGEWRPLQGGGAAWSASPSGELFQILMESGADLNAREMFFLPYPHVRDPYPDESDSDSDHEGFGSLLAITLVYFGQTALHNSLSLEIVTTLLRAGARLESIVEDLATGFDYSASWCLNWALADRPGLAQDEYFIKTRELILGIQEDGSFKRFMRRPHREILRLRSLFSRGRATPPCAIRCRRLRCYGAARQDYAMEFLVKLPDNGVLWNILSFWRASE